MLLKNLISFGLTEKEAQAYLSLLELEIAGVQELAKAAGLNRSSTYVTLEALKKKGLVHVSDDKKIRRYSAASPDTLLRNADDMLHTQETIRNTIASSIPEMKALYKSSKKKPLVKVFEGTKGLINAFEDTLISKEKLMRVSSSIEHLNQILPDYLPEYIKKRFKLGIKMHSIHPESIALEMLIKHSPKNFDTPLGIPKEKYAFPADMAIYDNKISYMSHHDGGIAIVIESKEMSDVMKSVFDLAWEEAKRLHSTKKSKNTKRLKQ